MPIFTKHWIDPTTQGVDVNQLINRGPSLQVEISIPASLAADYVRKASPIPSPIIGYALIDTGASVTCVNGASLEALGVSTIGTTSIQTPSGPDIKPLYPCKISFPGTPIGTLNFNAVVGCPLEAMGCIALIGRDILQNFILIYNGVEGIWTLAY